MRLTQSSQALPPVDHAQYDLTRSVSHGTSSPPQSQNVSTVAHHRDRSAAHRTTSAKGDTTRRLRLTAGLDDGPASPSVAFLHAAAATAYADGVFERVLEGVDGAFDPKGLRASSSRGRVSHANRLDHPGPRIESLGPPTTPLSASSWGVPRTPGSRLRSSDSTGSLMRRTTQQHGATGISRDPVLPWVPGKAAFAQALPRKVP